MKALKWHFRNNKKRKKGKSNKGMHPCLIIGESDDGKAFINIGLTKSPKRGHHKNIKIHNPVNWTQFSYLRDDIQSDLKEYLTDVLFNFKLNPEDIDSILEIINKKNSH